ncbi:16S rRNA (guanine(527)-N(7))-methyltransferase RsmG [Cognatiyoonia sp. IB215446]|uniref:16S rRNA (guanine(527)-N(7))-methyltransferase RsmG n=1 Tax=Cognatiyoonia sp. IB215446 TaxID=3097355 RepID=UPI002A15807B|nr:16S rRNA (guanine(527)-N(7))-methyltransferase RsmG [Cognatiyoonia sp. IB215446]MDX8349184.1 16S rRNA (guanine(527)-N(7))-methyltransferase RsmG [Cognatiyoonia sp. IB215446]
MNTQMVAGQSVSRETYDDLVTFRDLVTKWTPKINLIAPSTVPDMWERHIVDSAQLYAFTSKSFAHWVDLGSGGGFPGIVMAIFAKVDVADARFTLIESDQRKATFLRTAARQLSLNVTVISERIDQTAPQEADIVSARALAPLSALFPMTSRHLKEDGKALFHKGKGAATEIADARRDWSFALEQHDSITDPAARLLIIQRISRVSE